MIDTIEVTRREEYVLGVKDNYHPFLAEVKWDGCVHFWMLMNSESTRVEADYIHICDLHGLIESLQALEILAKEHFGKEWP